MLSPTNAPPAAARTQRTTLRSPAPASTPAVIATVSLGTIGKNASSIAIAKTSTYVHDEPETASTIDSNTGPGRIRAPWRSRR